ncbi:hypothetical protein K501DRAFT_283523 [Backusella circina FSU 941]|nr:hypothetical protein K501DRAFT_283523 [Backusella circina FSU 941]
MSKSNQLTLLRNRSKKVKCDFVHPECTRCQQAKVECCYDGSSTQVDLFNLTKLNDTVNALQQKVQSIETDMKDVSQNTQYIANEVRARQEENNFQLSLTPKGLRIDTNIMSLHDLYHLLSGAGVSNERTVLRRKPLWKTKLKTLPLYSNWESSHKLMIEDGGGVIQEHHHQHHHQQQQQHIPKETMDKMIDIFRGCFLCFPCPDKENSIMARYHQGRLDPLLANAVFAWTARHGAIYHDLFPGRDPNLVGEPFFRSAQELIKERFTKTSTDTMQSLLIMYIYANGIPSESRTEIESEAYLYLGLAIRMCLDLKMNQESKDPNPYRRELSRRFFWVLYFLETLDSTHSDRPFSLPHRSAITVQFPTVMDHEQHGEIRYRVEFMIQRFKITRIYRDIIYKTTGENPLLADVSALDKELKDWRQELPEYFKYNTGDIQRRQWDTTSFREQACIKLNFEYNFQLCQLHGLFFSKTSPSSSTDEEADRASPIEEISRKTCLNAASQTIELLECWVQLRQLWCHFSIENLMMTTFIYGNILQQSPSSETALARANLKRISDILLSAPVRHHRYVYSLVNKIKSILQGKPEREMDMAASSSSSTSSSAAASSTPLGMGVPPEPLLLDVASASSIFDMHKTDHFSQGFSDFVYPQLLDYSYDPNQFAPTHHPPPPPHPPHPPHPPSDSDPKSKQYWDPVMLNNPDYRSYPQPKSKTYYENPDYTYYQN